jgi:hypothetical protein
LESINQNGIGSILILPDVMMQRKSFMLKDCLPNVPDNLEYYFKNSDAILKTAPLLDISAGILELKCQNHSYCSFRKRCKRTTMELHKDYTGR